MKRDKEIDKEGQDGACPAEAGVADVVVNAG